MLLSIISYVAKAGNNQEIKQNAAILSLEMGQPRLYDRKTHQTHTLVEHVSFMPKGCVLA